MAYLEQSTRYVPYTDRPGGRWKYHVPAELDGSPLRDAFVEHARSRVRDLRALDSADGSALPRAVPEVARRLRRRLSIGDPRQGARHAARPAAGGDAPRTSACSAPARRSKRCCCACSRIRSRKCAAARGRCSTELRQVIPAFLARVDQPDRGGRWIDYFAETRRALRRRRARRSSRDAAAEPRDEVTLTDFDPDGEIKVVAAALYARLRAARRSAARDRAAHVAPTSAPRCCAPTSATARNRRHKPGRAFERTSYRFDVLADYGAFRDLQRHRLLTLDWQPLSAAPRLHRAGRDRGSRRPRRLARGDGPLGRRCYDAARRARPARRRPVRRGDGLSRPLLHGHERARGDARDRAAHRAAGPSVVPPRLPADAPRDRGAGRPPRDRRGDAVRRSLGAWSSSGCSRSARWKRSALSLRSWPSSASTRRGTSATRTTFIRSKNRTPSR